MHKKKYFLCILFIFFYFFYLLFLNNPLNGRECLFSVNKKLYVTKDHIFLHILWQNICWRTHILCIERICLFCVKHMDKEKYPCRKKYFLFIYLIYLFLSLKSVHVVVYTNIFYLFLIFYFWTILST